MAIAALSLGAYGAQAQTMIVSDFESFTLAPNSAYSPTVSTPFQTANATFEYAFDTTYSYWSGGFAYTNDYDSITPGFANLYGVRAYKGYNNSNIYVVGQDEAVIKAPAQATVTSFYITNTTFAYKSMKSGDQFAKKFGGTTGNDPDFFKVIVKGYKNGVVKNDSVTVMLADYTFTNNTQDYILNTWQLVNTAIIGQVDSLQFFMRSSDVGEFGINTPLYFALDNFTTETPVTTGLPQYAAQPVSVSVYPNPFNALLSVKLASFGSSAKATALDVTGKAVYTQELKGTETVLDLNALSNGVYFLEIVSGSQHTVKRIIKN